MPEVKGSFELQRQPLDADEATRAVGAMRMKFEKQFKGPLTAISVVSMMGVMDHQTGSGAYLALEKVTGELDGRKGSFLFQHSSTMARSRPRQRVLVVPTRAPARSRGSRAR